MRLTAIIALLCAGAGSSACYAWRPVAGLPRGDAHVTVRLTGPRTIVTVGQGSDTTRTAHPAVVEASGWVHAATRDTVTLRLGWLHTGTANVPQVAGRLALLPADAIARVTERRFQPVATGLAGFGLAGITLSVFLVVILTAMFKGF